MAGKEFFSILLGLSLASCAPNPVAPPNIEPGQTPNPLPPNALTLTPTELPQQTPSDRELLLTPEVRRAAMNATAESVQARGVEGLTAEGFPDKIIPSQKNIGVEYRINALVDGVENSKTVIAELGSTVIDLAGTSRENYFLISTVGHGFDRKVLDPNFMTTLKESFGDKEISITDVVTDTISLGKDLTLGPKDYGIDFGLDMETHADHAFLVIDKRMLTPENREALTADAIPAASISFSAPEKNQDYYGISSPIETDLRPVVGIKARFKGEFKDETLFAPWLAGSGSSGSGVFSINGAGELEYGGVIVGVDPHNLYYVDVILTYQFSTMGEDKFWESVDRAIADAEGKK